MLPMKRPAQQRSKRIEEEEEDEEDDLLVKPAGRQAKKARTSGAALLPLFDKLHLIAGGLYQLHYMVENNLRIWLDCWIARYVNTLKQPGCSAYLAS